MTATNPQALFRDELRAKHGNPTTRGKAIVMFCRECCGGAVDARKCETRDCFLWPFGPAAKAEKRRAKGEKLAEEEIEAAELDATEEPESDEGDTE